MQSSKCLTVGEESWQPNVLLTCTSSSLNACQNQILSVWSVLDSPGFVRHIVRGKRGKLSLNDGHLSQDLGKRAEVQDHAELQVRMISTVSRYFKTQTCAKMVPISCPQSCQRMLLWSSQTLPEADSQNMCQVIHGLPSNCHSGGAYNGNCCSNWRGNGKHMFQWEKTIKQRSGWLGNCSHNSSKIRALGSELRAMPSSNTWVAALCLISRDNFPSIEASSKHVLKWRYETEDTKPKAHFMLNY